jgi:hypothetical protein
MSRIKSILIAGTFTGLILITVLALWPGSLEAQTPAATSSVAAVANDVSLKNSLTSEEALRAWQDYSAQLEQTVRVLQARDQAYQQQLDSASRTIVRLQAQINSDPGSSSIGQHEEHEREEHGSLEFGEFDD